MDFGLRDRVAIVAAASRGIGFACALELAREGAHVFLCSRVAEHAAEAAKKIHEQTGANVAGFACDVTNNAEVEAFVNLASERAGRIDVCVTNAGGPPAKTFAETDLDLFRHAFELNALSAIRFAKLLLPGMLDGDGAASSTLPPSQSSSRSKVCFYLIPFAQVLLVGPRLQLLIKSCQRKRSTPDCDSRVYSVNGPRLGK